MLHARRQPGSPRWRRVVLKISGEALASSASDETIDAVVVERMATEIAGARSDLQVELWEAMLAVMKLGAVVLPTTTALGPAELTDRVSRGGAKHVLVNAADTGKFDSVPGDYARFAVGETGEVPGE